MALEFTKEEDYLGTGPVYPLQLDKGVGVLVSGLELVKSDLVKLFSTPKGQRDFNPDYGSRLWELHMEPEDAIFEAMAREFIVEAVDEWEPRVRLRAIEFLSYARIPKAERLGNPPTLVEINVQLELKATRETDWLIYPFYKAEEAIV